MKIAILGTRGFPNIQGGVEKHCEGLTINLVKLGCEVVVFTRKPYVNKSLKEFDGVTLIALPAFRHKSLEAFCHTFIGIFAALRYKPDILHIQGIGPGLFTPLARILGMNVVLTSHGSNYKHLKWGKFAKLVLRLGEFLGVIFANEVIAISKTIADEIKKKYRRDAEIIPNGVATAQVYKSNGVIKKYGLEKGKYILAVGRFVPEKAFDNLIAAYSKLPTPNSKLVIVGNADHEDKYSLDLKKKAGENSNIVLTGFLTKEPLRELYSHAGLFVLPSYYEGLPIVLLEAVSFGLSCIASDIPANKEVGLSEERFFKAGDVEALAEKMKEFADRPFKEEEKRKQMDMIAQRYNWEEIAERTLDVYRKVMQS